MAKEVHNHTKEFIDALIGYFTASGGFLVFGADLMKALLLGVFGSIGSLFVRWVYYKYIKKDGRKDKGSY